IEANAAAAPNAPVSDITRGALAFPADRDLRLQALARGDEGFLLALGYSTQRGYGRTHPFAGEIRMGEVEISFVPEELGFEVPLGAVTLTECEMVNQFAGSADAPPQFTRGYGLVFGQSERKAMAMSLVDRALRAGEFGEERTAVAQDEEFVIAHCDNVQATGFVEHLKLPHYVDFQAELDLVRRMRAEQAAASRSGAHEPGATSNPPLDPHHLPAQEIPRGRQPAEDHHELAEHDPAAHSVPFPDQGAAR
ncbi:MAG: carbon-phosphorus lyase complex subunit PhnI, partial [Rhizobiaceae bacterium]|nr:carbon-phosphorus lyase complex subunit PhnI [Rhizobiaceae bacterium]